MNWNAAYDHFDQDRHGDNDNSLTSRQNQHWRIIWVCAVYKTQKRNVYEEEMDGDGEKRFTIDQTLEIADSSQMLNLVRPDNIREPGALQQIALLASVELGDHHLAAIAVFKTEDNIAASVCSVGKK